MVKSLFYYYLIFFLIASVVGMFYYHGLMGYVDVLLSMSFLAWAVAWLVSTMILFVLSGIVVILAY